jgi:hypothetical protein
MSIAIPSYGHLLQMSDDSVGTNFTTIGGIKNPGQLKDSTNMVDVTEHNTGDSYREMAPTLQTLGALTLQLNWVVTNATHRFSAANGLGYVKRNRLKRVFRWIYNSDAGSDYEQFAGYVSDIAVSAALDNVYDAQVQITPTGAPTHTVT